MSRLTAMRRPFRVDDDGGLRRFREDARAGRERRVGQFPHQMRARVLREEIQPLLTLVAAPLPALASLNTTSLY